MSIEQMYTYVIIVICLYIEHNQMKQSQSRVMKHVHSWQRIKRFAINGLINVHQIGTKFHERRVSSYACDFSVSRSYYQL